MDEASSVLILTTAGPICSTTLTIGVLRLLISAQRGAAPNTKVERTNNFMRSRKLHIEKKTRDGKPSKACRLKKTAFISDKTAMSFDLNGDIYGSTASTNKK